MFEDFDKSQTPSEGRGRMGASLLISAGIFLGIMAAIAAAIATARVVVKRRQRDVDVSFADMPRAPKPKLAQKPAPGTRKAAPRVSTRPPKEIPQEVPDEAEGKLAEAGATGPVEGFTDGAGDGKGTAPAAPPPPAPPPLPPPPPMAEQQTETIAQPKFVSGCRTPEIPDTLQGTAATIQIEVRLLIAIDGTVTSATVLKSHPLIPDDVILRCARAQVFEPAHLPDGTAVPYPYRRRFVFRPAGV
jgi:hypothetical protein